MPLLGRHPLGVVSAERRPRYARLLLELGGRHATRDGERAKRVLGRIETPDAQATRPLGIVEVPGEFPGLDRGPFVLVKT